MPTRTAEEVQLANMETDVKFLYSVIQGFLPGCEIRGQMTQAPDGRIEYFVALFATPDWKYPKRRYFKFADMVELFQSGNFNFPYLRNSNPPLIDQMAAIAIIEDALEESGSPGHVIEIER